MRLEWGFWIRKLSRTISDVVRHRFYVHFALFDMVFLKFIFQENHCFLHKDFTCVFWSRRLWSVVLLLSCCSTIKGANVTEKFVGFFWNEKLFLLFFCQRLWEWRMYVTFPHLSLELYLNRGSNWFFKAVISASAVELRPQLSDLLLLPLLWGGREGWRKSA